MRFLFLSHLQNARDSLRANRMRTFLTITGVMIGITSIVAILALASGAGSIVSKQVDELGGNIAIVRPGTAGASKFNDVANQQAHQSFSTSTLTTKDVEKLANIPHVDAVAPLMIVPGTIQGDHAAPAGSTIVASTSELLAISNLSLRDGQFSEESTPLAVIGAQLSVNLFGTEDSLGKKLTIRGAEFRVSGIFDRSKTPVNFNGVDFNNAVLITPNQAKMISQTPQIQQINIRADSVANLKDVVAEANKTLLATHADEHDFSVLTGDSIAEPTSQLFAAIAGMTIAVAGISLLVGGIGIMNIMLVNVTERTREIGIRKALGASQRDVVWQFLIESLIMGMAGGIAGIAGGYGLAFIISLFLTFDPVVHWSTPLIALGVAAGVGLLFGLYPAYRAAKKNPIDSLQHF